MVKERTSDPITSYDCDKCGWPYSTREKAEECEAQILDRIYVSGKEKTWMPGDVAMMEVHCGENTGYRLVKIDHEYESKHQVRPFWVPIDGLGPLPVKEVIDYSDDSDDWMNYTGMHMLTMNARILNEKWTHQLLTIADTLRGLTSKVKTDE